MQNYEITTGYLTEVLIECYLLVKCSTFKGSALNDFLTVNLYVCDVELLSIRVANNTNPSKVQCKLLPMLTGT